MAFTFFVTALLNPEGFFLLIEIFVLIFHVHFIPCTVSCKTLFCTVQHVMESYVSPNRGPRPRFYDTQLPEN